MSPYTYCKSYLTPFCGGKKPKSKLKKNGPQNRANSVPET